MSQVTINGQQFIKTSICGDGNCFLSTLLKFMQQQGIDPFLKKVPFEQQSTQAYRIFLLTELQKFDFIAEKQKLDKKKWAKLKTDIENTVKDKDLLKNNKWLPSDFLKLIVVIYKKIDEVYVVDISNERKNVLWTRYAVKEGIAKEELVERNFNITKKTLLIKFTGIHYDLLTATEEQQEVVVKRKRSAEEESFDEVSNAAKKQRKIMGDILSLETIENDTLLSETQRSEVTQQLAKKKKELQEVSNLVFRKKASYDNMTQDKFDRNDLEARLQRSKEELQNLQFLKKEKLDVENEINRVNKRIEQIQRELRMKQQKLDDEKTVDLRAEDESQGTNSQTNSSDNAITIEDASDDEEKSGNLIQNRSLMSLSRMRL